MAECGTQCYLCDLPIRFDTYIGCSHGCEYCFAKKFKDINKIKKGEGIESLKKFIKGERNLNTKWCDWNIPLHWGGMSDPFQPVEKKHRVSYECLKYLKETQYPFIISTKGKLVADEEYLSLLEKCNCVVQISMVCSSYDKLELGTPTYAERLEIVRKISPRVKRVIIRLQPYMHEVFEEVLGNLKKLKEAGAYGVIIEGMKYNKKIKGMVKVGGDWTYPYELIKNDFLQLREEAHRLGLKIYAGENRLRKYGDSLTCCGVDGMEGFIPNKFNLNHLLNGDKQKPTKKTEDMGTGHCFRAMKANSVEGPIIEKRSFAYNMLNYYKENKNSINEVMGVNKK